MRHSVLPSLRALLAGSVDYAGLFPPAGLALGPALENHAAYARGLEAWMLGRFVLPVAKWPDAAPMVAGKFDAHQPLRISALGQKANAADDFLENLRTGLRGVVDFRRAQREALTIDQLEAPLPPETVPALGALLREAAGLIENCPLEGSLRAFWEVPFSDELPALVRCVADHNAQVPRTFRSPPFGVKLRTGGTEASAFPTPAQLASALLAARDAGVAVKFTAGLHHPLRHFDETLGTRMHGFLNVFAAGVLAREHGLDTAETRAVLEDERPDSFRFDTESFAWQDRRVPTAALAAHREFITSFGSCSFDEPRDDLRRLGLMA